MLDHRKLKQLLRRLDSWDYVRRRAALDALVGAFEGSCPKAPHRGPLRLTAFQRHVLALVVTLCSVFACTDADEEAWTRAAAAGSRPLLEQYVAEHAAGRHVVAARERLQALAEDDDWRSAERSGSVESWQRYIDVWPNGPRADHARAHIAELIRDRLSVSIRDLGSADESRREVAKATIRAAGPAAAAPLIAVLATPDSGVRWRAAALLGELRSQDALAPLSAALRDPDPDVREQAAGALGLLGKPSAAPALVDALRDPIQLVRDQALLALGGIDDSAACAALLGAFDQPAPFNPRHLVTALGRAACLEDQLVARLGAVDGPKRALIIEVLGGIGTPTATKAVFRELGKSPEEAVRSLARMNEPALLEAALAGMEDAGPESVMPIITMFQGRGFYKADDLTLAATRILLKIAPVAIQPLVVALAHPDETLVEGVVHVLQQLGDPAVPSLIDAMSSGGFFSKRRAAAEALSVSARPDVWQAILTAARGGDQAVVKGALFLIIREGDESLEDVVLATLRSEGDRTMAQALLNCGNGRLERAAQIWAAENGFQVSAFGFGGSPAIWGHGHSR